MRFLEVEMDFKSKKELVDFVKEQCGVVLENDEDYTLNKHPDLLYTEIPKTHKNQIFSLFRKKNIQTNEHLNGKYWIYLVNEVRK